MSSSAGSSPRYGCAECWPDSPDVAWQARRRLQTETELIDESHFRVSILRCPACRQAFLSLFMETIDWADGDDPQFWSVMPVADDEIEKLTGARVSQQELAAIGPDRRSLFRAAPKGEAASNRWASGVVLVFHD